MITCNILIWTSSVHAAGGLQLETFTSNTCHIPMNNLCFESLLTYSLKELSPSWRAANFAATQELPSILWNPNVQHRVHKSPPQVPILSHINPIHTISSVSLRSILILSTHLRLGLPSGPFPTDFPTNILYEFLFSPFVLHAPPTSSFLTWSF
jgi:hypothetical protein